MNHFIKTLLVLLTATIATSIFSGCAHQPCPCPEDTVLSKNWENRPDWIDEEEIYAEEGLAVRTNDSFKRNEVKAYINNTPTTSVYFGFDHSNITSKERKKLQTALNTLKSNSDARLLIVGHCDWYGTEEYNMALGDRRARTVQKYMVKLGADPTRIKTLSKGAFRATVGGKPDKVWKDRRSDVIVML